MKKKYICVSPVRFLCAVATSAVLLTGCGGDRVDSGMLVDSAVTSNVVSSGIMSKSYEKSSKSYNLDENTQYSSSTDTVDKSGSNEQDITNDRKLIRNVSISVEVANSDDLAKSIDKAIELTQGCKGYASNQSQDYGYNSYGDITVKIPKDKTDSFIEDFKKEPGLTLRDYSDNIEDITMQYLDVESRLQSSKTAKDRYMSMLEKAETVNDVLDIQSRIDSIIANEESYQRQLTAMDAQIDYTTINIHFSCAVNTEKMTFGTKLGKALRELLEDSGDSLLAAISWFVASIIWLIFILPVMTIIIRVFLFAIGKGKKIGEKKWFKIRRKPKSPAVTNNSYSDTTSVQSEKDKEN